MPTLTIDGQKTEVEKGRTILDAARALGITIPTFCYHQGLSIAANCRMCLVEIKGMPKPMPSCHTQAAEGMEVFTDSETVKKARKGVLEFILLNHPVDCPICDQAGECVLQDHYFKYSARASRLNTRKVHKPKAVAIGPRVTFDGERCINCTQCVRFLREVTGSNQLTQMNRGDHTEITTFPGARLDDPYSLCTVDLCPVGALTSTDFRFKERVWWLDSATSICPECETGCNLTVDFSKGSVKRTRPRRNMEVNKWWACDQGRLAFHRYEKNRWESVMVQDAGDQATPALATTRMAELLTAAGDAKKQVQVLLSASISSEDALVAARFAKETLGLSSVSVIKKTPGEGDSLLRSSGRDSNSRGVALVLKSLGLAVVEVSSCKTGDAALLVGLDDEHWSESLARSLGDCTILALSCFADRLTSGARVVLPLASPYEDTGLRLNKGLRLQEFRRAITPPGQSSSAWRWLLDISAAMNSNLGPARLIQLRQDLAARTGNSAWALNPFPTEGIGLEQPSTPSNS